MAALEEVDAAGLAEADRRLDIAAAEDDPRRPEALDERPEPGRAIVLVQYRLGSGELN